MLIFVWFFLMTFLEQLVIDIRMPPATICESDAGVYYECGEGQDAGEPDAHVEELDTVDAKQ